MRLAVSLQHNVATALPALEVVGLDWQQAGQEGWHPSLQNLCSVRGLTSSDARCPSTTSSSLHPGDNSACRLLAWNVDLGTIYHSEIGELGARNSRWSDRGKWRHVQRADDWEVWPGTLVPQHQIQTRRIHV
jgi:hypothetical protein